MQAEAVANIVVEGIDRHADGQDDQAFLDGVPEPAGIARRQGRGEFAGLFVEQHREAGLAEQQHDEQRQQAAGRPFFRAEPVRKGNSPKALPQMMVETDHRAGFAAGRAPGRGMDSARKPDRLTAQSPLATKLSRAGGPLAATCAALLCQTPSIRAETW